MNNLEFISSKIHSLESITEKRKEWNEANEKVVFTNGCFDILHLGHVEYLSKAKDLGGKLIIGLNSDFSVKNIKGEGRPYQDEAARKHVLASLFFVDAVVLFDEDTPYNLIKTIKPDVLVKGADYKVEEIVGHDIVLENGGEVIPIDLTDGYSSSNVINKLK